MATFDLVRQVKVLLDKKYSAAVKCLRSWLLVRDLRTDTSGMQVS